MRKHNLYKTVAAAAAAAMMLALAGCSGNGSSDAESIAAEASEELASESYESISETESTDYEGAEGESSEISAEETESADEESSEDETSENETMENTAGYTDGDGTGSSAGAVITDPETGQEYSASTVIISFDDTMTDERLDEICSKYGLEIIYKYQNFNMAALSASAPMSADELSALISNLESENGILMVNRDGIMHLDDATGADSDLESGVEGSYSTMDVY